MALGHECGMTLKGANIAVIKAEIGTSPSYTNG